MPRKERTKIYGPHLDRWVSLGLLTSWEHSRDEGRIQGWTLHWWDGRESYWNEAGLRAAIITADSIERRLAA